MHCTNHLKVQDRRTNLDGSINTLECWRMLLGTVRTLAHPRTNDEEIPTMSSLAWLDTSPDDERRMREIVRMFSDTSTLDDLGIGQVRDSLSDQMFPGTSTIHARPRYFLIIPWIYERAAAKYTGTMITSKANDEERKLIEVLRSPTPVRGMIGARAGKTVQNLPSSIYWSALQRYGILVDARGLRWNIDIPPPPGFPKKLDGGLDLGYDEAEWLRERIMTAAPGSYLSHLLAVGLDPDPDDAVWPWDHPALSTATTDIVDLVEHARLFSLAINGATLIYNLLIAERFDAVSADDQGLSAGYSDLLADWADEVDRNRSALDAWDVDSFWAAVSRGRSAPVALGTSIFVSEWIAKVRQQDSHSLASTESIRRMISDRERKNKGQQSRLGNERAIRNWGGSSGSARLDFRWPIVRRMLSDIRKGLDDAAS